MRILGIETSCDETAVALAEGKNGRVRELESLVASQIDIHKATGGVVPEVAAREHVSVIIPLIETLLGAKRKPDAIAVTSGPGLFSSLMVGVETAKALSFAWNVPLVRVNHIEGHICSALIGEKEPLAFPAVALVVSGGHTELILMKKSGSYRFIGRTKDDAAGEAFDKTAQMMGLEYPGGPAISKASVSGDARAFALPRPMLESGDYAFSFSGLKTAVLYSWRDATGHGPRATSDMAASVQSAIVEVLTEKALRAAKEFKAKTLIAGGGVLANDALRSALSSRFAAELPHVRVRLPHKKYTTDNAVMIAAAGYYHALWASSPRKRGSRNGAGYTPWQKLQADPNWELI